jgi:hypothetical protein
MRILYRSLSSLLSAVLVLGPSLEGQIPAAPNEVGVQELHLRPTDDTLAEYPIGSTYGPGIVIEVTDQANKPVPGAAVTFRFPGTGATGTFADGSSVAVEYTDVAGHAAFRNIRWNTTPGTLLLRVTVTKGIVHAGILVEQKLGAAQPGVLQQQSAPIQPALQPVAAGAQAPPQIGAPQVAVNPASAQSAIRPQPAQTLYPAPQNVASRNPGEPSVLITNDPGAHSGARGSSKKWLWIALIGAGAGAGAVLAMGKAHVGSSSSGSGSGVSIGTPSVSIGHP